MVCYPLVPLQPWGGLLCCAGASVSFLHTVSWNSLWATAMNIAKNCAEQGRALCFYVPWLASLNHICCVAEGNIALVAVGYWSTSQSHLQGVLGLSLISSVTKRRNLLWQLLQMLVSLLFTCFPAVSFVSEMVFAYRRFFWCKSINLNFFLNYLIFIPFLHHHPVVNSHDYVMWYPSLVSKMLE